MLIQSRVFLLIVLGILHLVVGSNGEVADEEEAEYILNTHNEMRAMEDAADMQKLEWNDDLADLADQWAQGCDWKHGQVEYDKSIFPWTNVLGQNMAAHEQGLTYEKALWDFYNEKPFWDFDTKKCAPGEMCGHYTQIVWADTISIGCGKAACPDAMTNADMKGYVEYIVCNYGPIGNNGNNPYRKGETCTECDPKAAWCTDGFCNPECDGPSDTCECLRKCEHCGTVDEDTCTCECTPGWTGIACERECKNYDEKCGANPGYPPDWCGPEHTDSTVRNNCPLMCGFCVEA